ncbi:MAG: undecaprenyl-diphosphate phosphatase [Spirochaetota bacterium]|jgi:undecaprenyl-diphosphatase|nr:undecaprenyl-diphosphate phosphatase [Spirochaetota bacterium]
MGVIEGILLGAIQGVTEFLPISSSGHLVLLGELILPGSASMDPFTEVVFHLGTLGAVLIVFAREVFSVFLSPLTVIPEMRANGRAALCTYAPLRLFGLVLLATIPIAVAGLLFHTQAEEITQRPDVVALLLGCTGVILLVSEWTQRKKAGEAQSDPQIISGKTIPTALDALIIGLAQAAAILPGLSRSGLTISAARLTGLRRENAGVFSFLIFIPALAGALLLQIYTLVHGSASADMAASTLTVSYPGALFIPAYHIAGFLSSFVFGLLALILLVRFLKSGNFHLFGWYCLAAALLWIIIL